MTRGLEVSVNGFPIVGDVSIDIGPGEIVGITGPNGAGKSTTLKTILGLGRRTRGNIWFDGTEITQMTPVEIARLGVSLVLQNARLPQRLTVHDALALCWNRGIPNQRVWRSESPYPWQHLASLDDVYARFPQLSARRSTRAGVLSAGEQQLLAIAMSLALRPRLLMLDEPSIGLHPLALRSLFEWLAELARTGLGLIIVEQRIPELRAIATRIFELSCGALVEISSPTAPGSPCQMPSTDDPNSFMITTNRQALSWEGTDA